MFPKNMTLFLTGLAVSLAVASPAMAYVGPGAGLSVVGALAGVVMAVGAALVFIVGWPVRRMMRRRKLASERSSQDEAGSSPAR
ncbi:MAG: hypothetical protein RIE84_01090 [Parvibaculum sp.]|uniref:hypothetical protein n=1 Tax=Parvibaculum sp. TaxID=2024848 RepID=UPI0032EB75A8